MTLKKSMFCLVFLIILSFHKEPELFTLMLCLCVVLQSRSKINMYLKIVTMCCFLASVNKLLGNCTIPLTITRGWRKARRAWPACEMSGRNGARRGILNNRLLLYSFYPESLPGVNISGKHHNVSAFSGLRNTAINRKLHIWASDQCWKCCAS